MGYVCLIKSTWYDKALYEYDIRHKCWPYSLTYNWVCFLIIKGIRELVYFNIE